jgi:hypothetical protein
MSLASLSDGHSQEARAGGKQRTGIVTLEGKVRGFVAGCKEKRQTILLGCS